MYISSDGIPETRDEIAPKQTLEEEEEHEDEVFQSQIILLY